MLYKGLYHYAKPLMCKHCNNKGTTERESNSNGKGGGTTTEREKIHR